MLCRMPVTVIPADFVAQVRATTGEINDATGPGVARYIGTNGLDTVDIFVGLVLDGVMRFRDISRVNSSIKMQYTVDPTLTCQQDEVFHFNPHNDKYINIKVCFHC